MKRVMKKSLALTFAGILVLAAASPSVAQTWRYRTPGTGFVAGAAVGAAAANAAMYGPAYQAYAYAPGQPGAIGYGNFGSDGFSGCAAVGNYGGKIDYGAC